LMQDGYLHRVRGLGSFVKEAPRQSSLLELRNIADEIAARGHEHRAEVIDLVRVKADSQLAESFKLPPGRTDYRLCLVHFDNGLPVQLERRHVNPAVAPLFLRQDFTRITPTAYLLSVAPVDELEHRIRAVQPDAQARRLLQLGPNEPCLELSRVSWSAGHVATRVQLIYPGSRYELKSRYRTSPSGRFAQAFTFPES
jgi:GntR family histidine utilization transcriptional repressor